MIAAAMEDKKTVKKSDDLNDPQKGSAHDDKDESTGRKTITDNSSDIGIEIQNEVFFPPVIKKRIERYEGCMRFKCANYTQPHCQDNFADTDYTGENPPCCSHVLRDMIRTMDDALFDGLGLEYFAGYGTLLGLIRNDHVIPWVSRELSLPFFLCPLMYKNLILIAFLYTDVR